MRKGSTRFRRLEEERVKHLKGIDAMRVIAPELAKPLQQALEAIERDDIMTALAGFAKCHEVEPNNKATLVFAADPVQAAYFRVKHSDPQPPPEKLAQYRDIALTITAASVEVTPDDPVAWHNYGRLLDDDGETEQAIEQYRKALLLDRSQIASWGNLGTALYTMGHVDEAERCWSKCVAFDAEKPSDLLAQAYVWLRRGDFLRGWPALNARWQEQFFAKTYGRRDLRGKPWTGQPLKKGESVLLHGEQGFGDHVMFARWVPRALERVRVAGLETRAPLKRWFEATFPGLPVFVRDQDHLPTYTHHCPLMSLPGILGGEIPPSVSPEYDRSNVIRATSPQPRVGIVWAGTAGNMADAVRSIPAECLTELAGAPVTWVPLQYDPSGMLDVTARAWLGKGCEPTPAFTDVYSLGEAMLGLDAIVTVDTLALHIAGSLGLPTTALHRFNREWRWGQHVEACPWYPSVTHLTQSKPGEWRELLQRLRARLAPHQ